MKTYEPKRWSGQIVDVGQPTRRAAFPRHEPHRPITCPACRTSMGITLTPWQAHVLQIVTEAVAMKAPNHGMRVRVTSSISGRICEGHLVMTPKTVWLDANYSDHNLTGLGLVDAFGALSPVFTFDRMEPLP